MAIIGFAVGVFVGVIVVQRITQRHIFVLQKKRLVEEYRVADLSTNNANGVHFEGDSYYDPELGQEMDSHTINEMENEQDTLIDKARQQQVLSTENESHLRKLGLFG
mmetsp:Transcript_57430/g.171314  ORF Transcript_57430/g.171314 Transcript_57430/m.171314 type:complete len:107 (-) Transcript_57430:276-596(-)